MTHQHRVVDMHAHALAPIRGLVEGLPGHVDALATELATFGEASVRHNARQFATSWRVGLSELSVRLDAMDASGVDMQVVGVAPTQYHEWAEPRLATELVKRTNDHLASLAAQAPHRISAMAHVAFQHPHLAAEQLRDAVRTFGMRSVQVSTRSGLREFSHPDLEEFWAAAAELDVLVFVHPWGCSLGGRLSDFYLGNIVGQPLETTLALSHLIFSGVLDRHPGLTICAAHGGGYLPAYLGRADHAFDVRPESRTTAVRPSQYMRRIYVDTLVYRPDQLRQLVDVCGADRVLLGTDFPFDMGVDDPLERLRDAGLAAGEVAMIAGLNALDVLAYRMSGPGEWSA